MSRCFAALALMLAGSAAAAPPIYLEKTTRERAKELQGRTWIETIELEVQPLSRDPGKRMPMIMWHGVGFEPLSPAQHAILKERGLCQHLQLSESMIVAAEELMRADMPVILMEGRTDSWPYNLAKNADGGWAHQFDVTYEQPWFGKEDATQWHGACPHRTEGWRVMAERVRSILEKFRDAEVRVDAVLVDYEGDPYPWPHLFDQLRHCKRCRSELPADVVHDRAAWRDFAWKLYVKLYDEHFAKVVREVYPECLVSNWHVVYSSQSDPVRYFVRNVDLPELKPQFFSATNPIAYASDSVWHQLWDPSRELTGQSVDDFFAKQLVHQVAADRRNRIAVGADQVRSIPWVSRVCRLDQRSDKPAPIMSRSRYRRSLGELWNQGIESMQIFNPMHEGYEELSILEVQDAVDAYNRMLGRRD